MTIGIYGHSRALTSTAVAHWGDVPTWVAAIGTVLAFAVTSIGLALERRARERLEARQAHQDKESAFVKLSEQARLVGGYLTGGGTGDIFVTLINASPLPVANVEVVAIAEHFPGWSRPYRLGVTSEIEGVVVLDPHTNTGYRHVPVPAPHVAWHLEMTYNDDSGQRWHKYGPEAPLMAVARDFTLYPVEGSSTEGPRPHTE